MSRHDVIKNNHYEFMIFHIQTEECRHPIAILLQNKFTHVMRSKKDDLLSKNTYKLVQDFCTKCLIVLLLSTYR